MNSYLQSIFTNIYDNKIWGFVWEDESTYSGPGSTIKYTENLRNELPKLYKKFNITSVLDAPCGDLNWMKSVIDVCPNVHYIGGDIVKSMMDSNTKNFGKQGVEFIELDITSNKLPQVDLMICRDCLFHLHKDDIFKFIDNFIDSNIKYLLTTTYPPNDSLGPNRIISPGNWFNIDLLSDPYNFTENALYKIDDWIPGFHVRYMYLWDRDQIISARNSANK